jgi:hypothetical protein
MLFSLEFALSLTHADLYAGALKPRIRPFAIYDATISYPLRGDTIPAWVAIVIPFALMAISLCIGELILFKRVSAVLSCKSRVQLLYAARCAAWLPITYHTVTAPLKLKAIQLVKSLLVIAQVHRNITMALSTMLHFLIDIAVAFLFTIFMTELTKVATGVLR